jgi:hypothetical protein
MSGLSANGDAAATFLEGPLKSNTYLHIGSELRQRDAIHFRIASGKQ